MTRRIRAVILQGLLLAALVGLVLWIVQNTVVNLQARNLASGFDFLGRTAGFSINQALIDYGPRASYGRALLVGLLNTLLVSVLSIIFATVLGFAIGIARRARNKVVAGLAATYVETVRNIPLLLQLFVWYFAVLRPLPPPTRAFAVLDTIYLSNRGLQFPRLDVGDAAGAMMVAAVVGFGAAIFLRRRLKRHRLLAGVGLVVGLPLLVWLVMGLPLTIDRPVLGRFNYRGGVALRPEFLALFLGLSTYTAAFIAELVRAGLASVPRGQIEAAAALGLSGRQALRFVVLPQALRVIVPPLAGQYLNLIKNSSLAVAIAYPDLVSVFAGTALSQTGQAIEIVGITMAIYLALSLLTAWAMNVYNQRLAIKER